MFERTELTADQRALLRQKRAALTQAQVMYAKAIAQVVAGGGSYAAIGREIGLTREGVRKMAGAARGRRASASSRA